MTQTALTKSTAFQRSLWIVAIVLTCVWLATLGGRKLIVPDEGRYAEIAREMVANDDWLTPRVNDLKYLEKPPLQYWATSTAYRFFGMNEFSARIWCALTGLAGIFVAGWAGARLYGRDAGIVSAAVLASSLMYVVLGHINTLDMGLSFFLELAIVGFLLAQQSPLRSRAERNFMLLAWGATALAVLSKGIVALALPVITLIAYSTLERDFSAWRRLHVLAGSALFLLFCSPWFVWVSIENPEFAGFFFLHEHIQRYLTDVSDRVEPWWYFIPVLLVGVLPWTSLALRAGINAWRDDQPNDRAAFRTKRFLLLWIIVSLVFFSASHSKLPPYVLPLFPAIALLVGDFVVKVSPTILARHLLGVAILWFVALGVALLARMPTGFDVPPDAVIEVFRFAAIAFAVALIGTSCAWLLVRKGRIREAMLCACAGTLLAASTLLHDFQVLRHLRSSYDLAQTLAPLIEANKPFYSIWTYDPSLSFYLRRNVTLVDFRGELEFGQQQEPAKVLPDTASFIDTWPSKPPGSMAVMLPDAYDYLLWHNLHMIIVGRNSRLIAVKKP